MRIYVLLRSLDPLRVYVFKEGLCRLATTRYQSPSADNARNDRMHLTNYAINRQDPRYVSNKDISKDDEGHKRSYTSVLKHIKKCGLDRDRVEQDIEAVIVKTILAGYTKLLRSYQKTREVNTKYSPIKEGSLREENSEYNREEPSVCF